MGSGSRGATGDCGTGDTGIVAAAELGGTDDWLKLAEPEEEMPK